MNTQLPHSPVLNVVGLRKEFRVKRGGRARTLVAVDSVTIDVHPGETVALVGESGSGKSTVARCIVRLIDPTEGAVAVDGRDMVRMTRRELSRAYGDVQMVFQDPNSSLNPPMTIRQILTEPLRLHTDMDKSTRIARAAGLLSMVGLGEEPLD